MAEKMVPTRDRMEKYAFDYFLYLYEQCKHVCKLITNVLDKHITYAR